MKGTMNEIKYKDILKRNLLWRAKEQRLSFQKQNDPTTAKWKLEWLQNKHIKVPELYC